MLDEIILKAILTIVGFLVTGILGYLTAKVKHFKEKDSRQKEKDNRQEEALKCLLRSNITSKYYVYSELGEIPYYEKENINYLFKQYENMNGNSYVKEIVAEINNLPIKK